MSYKRVISYKETLKKKKKTNKTPLSDEELSASQEALLPYRDNKDSSSQQPQVSAACLLATEGYVPAFCAVGHSRITGFEQIGCE